jgi:hypothetical protein
MHHKICPVWLGSLRPQIAANKLQLGKILRTPFFRSN